MKQIFLLLLLIFVVTLGVSAQQTKKEKPVKLPRGIVMKDNRVTVSDKYLIEKTEKGAQILYRKKRGSGGMGIFASFSCLCKDSGSCLLSTSENELRCFPDVCSSCQLKITIAGNSASTVRQ